LEQPAKQRRYKTEPHAMGLRSGRNLDNIRELLAQIEGENFLLILDAKILGFNPSACSST
jgi:hypothetical protein